LRKSVDSIDAVPEHVANELRPALRIRLARARGGELRIDLGKLLI